MSQTDIADASRSGGTNRSIGERSVILFIAAVTTAILVRNSVLYLHFRGTSMTSAPAEWGYDDVDYDNLAFGIIHRGTFGFDWDDPEWRARYLPFNAKHYFDPVMKERHGFAPTTFKPPLVPFLLSVAYRMFGTAFFVGRVMNLAFMGAAVFLSVLFAGFVGGTGVALFTGVFILIRPHLESFGATLMTESVATFMFTATFIAIFLLVRRHLRHNPGAHLLHAAVAGLFLGLLVLTRTLYALWIPWVALLAAASIALTPRGTRTPVLRSWVVVFATFLLVTVPWGIRNSLVSGHLNPLGSEGITCLPGAYSDESYASFGEFAYAPFDKAYKEFEAMKHPPQRAPAELPYLRGIYTRNVALRWIASNWQKVPALLAMRMYSQHVVPLPNSRFFDASWLHFVFLAAFVLGCVGWWKKPAGRLFVLAFLLDCLAISLAYPSNSRFITPLIPVLGIASAGIFLLVDPDSAPGTGSFYRTPRSVGESAILLLTMMRDSFRHVSVQSFRFIIGCFRAVVRLLGCTAVLLFRLLRFVAIRTFRVSAALCRFFAQRGVILAVTVLLSLVSASYLAYAAVAFEIGKNGKLSYPPECACDDADYENIAFRLYTDGNFGFDWANPVWRSRYEAENADGHFSKYLERTSAHITTYQPSLLPFAVSVIYRIFGTGFLAPRIMNLVFMCLAVAVTVLFAGLEGGVIAAGLTAFLIYDWNLFTQFAAGILTESIATFFCTVFAIAFFTLMRRLSSGRQDVSIRLPLLCGASFGLLILTRSIFSLWLPFLVLIPLLSFVRRTPNRSARVRQSAIMIATILLVVSPWWIRNCLVSYHFAPLGSQGTTGLPGGYSDEAFADGGNWNYTAFRRPYDEFEKTFHGEVRSAPEKEFLRGEFSKNAAIRWATDHWGQLPSLFLMRLETHYQLSLALFIAILAGLACWLMVPGGWVFAYLLLLDAFSIVISYEANGRFLVPVFPIVVIAISGIVFLPRMLRGMTLRLGSLAGKPKNPSV